MFSHVYRDSLWAGVSGTKSGEGSSSGAAKCTRTALLHVLMSLSAHKRGGALLSMLDAPCGDLVWMPELWRDYLSSGAGRRLLYHGVDIVQPLIDSLSVSRRVRRAADASGVNVSFSRHDVTSMPLRRAYDLVFTRDMMIHLRNKDIFNALRVFAESGSRFLLATTMESGSSGPSNQDLPGGDNYRVHGAGHDIILDRPPWNLPPPLCASFQYQEAQEAKPEAAEPAVFLGLWDMHEPAFRERVGLVPEPRFAARGARARHTGMLKYGMRRDATPFVDG